MQKVKRTIYGAVALLAFLAMGAVELCAKETGVPGAGVLPVVVCLAVFILAAGKAGAFYKQ